MPIPRHSIAVASVQLAQTGECGGVTELRVHGVGGSPPDAVLGDLAPEQASGDQIAGFYRSDDHRASPSDQETGRDGDRHVEVYSWGGLTSRSKVRVLWLALLPFLFGNLAGWMCSARTFQSGWRFKLHRLSHGLCGLALTVNAALIAALISADLLAYQAVRAGRARGQWWLAPLGWHDVAGFPARQVLIGVLVPVLFLLLLAVLARRSWRYEKVRPPFHGETAPAARQVAASTLRGGLADPRFWDGEGSVRSLTRVHLAAGAGFLAVVLVIAGAAGLVSAGVFAWLQPSGPAGPSAALPGMAGVIGWTALAIAVALALALVSMLLGLRSGRGTLTGGPFVTLMMGFVLLNAVLLGAGIWVAHLVGPVTSDAAAAAQAIYVPYLITSGVPLTAWAAVAAVVVFGLVELGRWWRVRQLPETMHNAYFDQARAFVNGQPGAPEIWYESALDPDQKWERKVARTQFMARVPLDASWLLWGVISAQVTVTLCVWQLHVQPPVVIRNIGLSIAGLILPALMGFLYSAWSDPTKRRTVCV